MPDWAREVRSRLASLHLSPTRENEIVEELSQHLDERWRELVAGGTPPDEATRLALADFRGGDVLASCLAPLKQARWRAQPAPAEPSGRGFGHLLLDLRYAARLFKRQPAFAAAAVLTLALGIGATTAIFSVVYGVLLKPLPFREAHALVSVGHRMQQTGEGRNHGPDTYLTYREGQRAFEALGAWDRATVSIVGAGVPERVEALAVTSELLPLLRVQPLLGRFFTREDDRPGAPRRIVLTHAYWQRAFAGTPDIVGRGLAIDGQPAEIIGVLPASFAFLHRRPVVLLPLQLERVNGISFDFQVLGRLAPGVTIERASADIARLIPALHPSFAQLRLQPVVEPLANAVIGSIGGVLWILLAAVGLVLLIACANVANLFLVRAEGRQSELALRAALGASRGRIARGLLCESLLLGLAAGAVGLVLAQIAIGVLRRMSPSELPRVNEIALDPAVLLFTLAISLSSGLLFGLVPVWRFGAPGATALKDGGRAATPGSERQRTRHLLVVAEVALAVVLLVVSGLMIRSMLLMRQVDPGITRPEHLQTFRLMVPVDGSREGGQRFALALEEIARRLEQVPGVTSVGLSSSITLDGEDNLNAIEVEGAPVPEGQLAPLWRFKSFAPGYFETMGIRLVAGRAPTWPEIHGRRPFVVVSAALAREYWGSPAKAIGKRLRGNAVWREVIGVTADERDDGVHMPATAIVYWPLLNDAYFQNEMAFAVRSERVGTAGFVRELERAVWSVDRDLPLSDVLTAEEILARSMARTSFAMVMLALAAGVALLLGVVGIYGVIACVVVQRTREIGTRMALGAQPADVRRLFLGHGLKLTLIGIAAGIGVSLFTTRVMSALLFGVAPADPLTFGAVTTGLTAVAMLATYLPARRASRLDPMAALRSDT